jgi:exonuclease VII large subunit
VDEALSRLQLSGSRRLARVRSRLHELEISLAPIQPQAVIHRRHQQLADVRSRLQACGSRTLATTGRRLHAIEIRLVEASPQQRLLASLERVTQLARHLNRVTAHRLQCTHSSLESLETRLRSSSYYQTLARGFTITRIRKNRRIITRADQVAPGREIITETPQGEFTSRVSHTDQDNAGQQDKS